MEKRHPSRWRKTRPPARSRVANRASTPGRTAGILSHRCAVPGTVGHPWRHEKKHCAEQYNDCLTLLSETARIARTKGCPRLRRRSQQRGRSLDSEQSRGDPRNEYAWRGLPERRKDRFKAVMWSVPASPRSSGKRGCDPRSHHVTRPGVEGLKCMLVSRPGSARLTPVLDAGCGLDSPLLAVVNVPAAAPWAGVLSGLEHARRHHRTPPGEVRQQPGDGRPAAAAP